MQDKVWVIDAPDKKPLFINETQKIEPDRSSGQKNPALAFSFSLLFWGGGQFYNGQRKLGLFYLLLMGIFIASFVLTALYWKSVTLNLEKLGVTVPVLLFICLFFYLGGLVLWVLNALQAYDTAKRLRTEPFHGIKNRILPTLCSLLFPGWGQLLNGQFKKGIFFLCFTVSGLFFAPMVIMTSLLWSMLGNSLYSLFWDWTLAFALIIVPIVILFWLFNIMDALKVSLDEVKKESLLNRLRYANNRRRIQGFVRGVIPQAKLTILLSLFFIISLILGFYYFPKKYYVHRLELISTKFAQQGMVVVPELIEGFLRVSRLDDKDK